MSDSIAKELSKLESVGRVSARGQRPIHAEFGFSAMKRDEVEKATAPEDFAAGLDAARERLKAQIAPE